MAHTYTHTQTPHTHTHTTQPHTPVIVGGGLSGLVAGMALKNRQGVKDFLVTESRERVGGNITSMEGNGYVWEEGPNSFQPNDFILQAAVGTRTHTGACTPHPHTRKHTQVHAHIHTHTHNTSTHRRMHTRTHI